MKKLMLGLMIVAGLGGFVNIMAATNVTTLYLVNQTGRSPLLGFAITANNNGVSSMPNITINGVALNPTKPFYTFPSMTNATVQISCAQGEACSLQGYLGVVTAASHLYFCRANFNSSNASFWIDANRDFMCGSTPFNFDEITPNYLAIFVGNNGAGKE